MRSMSIMRGSVTAAGRRWDTPTARDFEWAKIGGGFEAAGEGEAGR